MSGSTIGGIAGAAIGYMVGGAQGMQVGWMVGSAVGGYVDPDVIKGQRLTDAQQQTSMEGAPRAIIYGTAVVAGNVIQAGPLVEHKHRDRTGKGGPVQESYSYTRTYAIRVCEGPIGNISRIWRDDKLVLDWRNPADWPDAAADINAMAGQSAKFASGITIYTGSETQLPDATLEALPTANGGGIGEVNAYRGTCYVVFADDDLTDRQGSIPQYRFEVSCCGDTSSTQNIVPWVIRDAETDVIELAAIEGSTAIITGNHNNTRLSTDGGYTWQAVDYLNMAGWVYGLDIRGLWWQQDIQFSAGLWYMIQQDRVAISSDGGYSWTNYITARYQPSCVGKFGGTAWAGNSAGGLNTLVFQPLNLANTDIDLGADYGIPTAIADVGGVMLIGTTAGKIVTASSSPTVLYTHPIGENVRQFACNANASICIAAIAGGYVRSIDGGNTWTYIDAGAVFGVTFARGKFYFMARDFIYSSVDGLALTEVDNSLTPNELAGFICTDSNHASVLAVTSNGKTATLPSAYNLPDIASGWHIDPLGNVVGDVVTSVDRCTADLDATVLDICKRAGITADQIDVSQLTDPLRGFVIGQPIAASDAIRTLQQGYFFDLPEWGDWPDTATKLRAIKRGGAAAFTVTDADLVDSDDDQDTRPQVVEFPRKINLLTSDVEADYNPTKQTFERRTDNIKAVGETSLQLSICTLRDEAAQMVDKMGKVAWEESLGRWERDLPEEFTALVPSDCFSHNDRRWRAIKVDGGDGSVKVEAVRDRISAYTSTATSVEAPAPTPPPITLRGPVVFAAMNLPSQRTADNVPGMYIATCGLLDGYAGCDLELSYDGGVSYAVVASNLQECTMGALTAACDSGATDLIAVNVVHGHELDSASDAQFAAGANTCAIVSGTTAEVAQFQTAEETGDGTYDLSDLVRGKGTDAAAHIQGDRFVLLDSNVLFLPINIIYAGQTLYFRPVSRGTAPANNRAYPVVFAPQFTSGAVIDFYTDASGAKYTDASAAFYYEES